MEESDISRTAMALHSLQIYGPPGRKAELDARKGSKKTLTTTASPGQLQ